jgi:hypothetical protein
MDCGPTTQAPDGDAAVVGALAPAPLLVGLLDDVAGDHRPGPRTPLVVRAEISDRQIRDMIDLYRQWAVEENRVFNEGSCMDHMIDLLQYGMLVPLVLVEDERAVGACFIMLYRYMHSGEIVAIADEFYIVPECRGLHGTQLMFEACTAFADFFDISIRRVPSRKDLADHYRKFLPPEYKIDTVIFTAEV